VVLPSEEEQPRAYEPRVRKKRIHRRQQSASPNVDESGPDSDSELDRDSGYNSQFDRESDANAEAMFYQQKMDEFEEEWVTLSNPCDETKAMMKAEEGNSEL
jgi:hypothetical protein